MFQWLPPIAKETHEICSAHAGSEILRLLSTVFMALRKLSFWRGTALSISEERCSQCLCCLGLGCFALVLLLFVWGFLVLFVFFFFFPVVELEHTSSQMLGRDSASELQALSPDIAT